MRLAHVERVKWWVGGLVGLGLGGWWCEGGAGVGVEVGLDGVGSVGKGCVCVVWGLVWVVRFWSKLLKRGGGAAERD